MEVFEETDSYASDSAFGFGMYECSYRNERLPDIECLMVYCQPMEYIEHMQTRHPGVDHGVRLDMVRLLDALGDDVDHGVYNVDHGDDDACSETRGLQ